MDKNNDIDRLLAIYKEVCKVDSNGGLHKVENLINAKRRRLLFIRLIAVAACCVTFTIGLLLTVNKEEQIYDKVVHDVSLKQSNGVVVNLTNVDSGRVVGGVIEGKNEIRFVNPDNPLAEIQYSEICTPLGAEYKITLSDGTTIWMNSCTTVEFPTNLSASKTREIKLCGEIFIDVATDSLRPFIITAGSSRVEVYGTKLNVVNYEENKKVEATLIEGSAAVIAANRSYPLCPGSQFCMNDERCEVKMVNMSQVLAWRYNLFLFDNQSFEVVIEQLERWYPVSFIFLNNNLRDVEFQGNIPRTATLNELLDYLKLCCDAEFIRKESVIYIN